MSCRAVRRDFYRWAPVEEKVRRACTYTAISLPRKILRVCDTRGQRGRALDAGGGSGWRGRSLASRGGSARRLPGAAGVGTTVRRGAPGRERNCVPRGPGPRAALQVLLARAEGTPTQAIFFGPEISDDPRGAQAPQTPRAPGGPDARAMSMVLFVALLQDYYHVLPLNGRPIKRISG